MKRILLSLLLAATAQAAPTLEIRRHPFFIEPGSGWFIVQADGRTVLAFTQGKWYAHFAFWVESVPVSPGVYEHRVHSGQRIGQLMVPDHYTWTGPMPKRIVIHADPRIAPK